MRVSALLREYRFEFASGCFLVGVVVAVLISTFVVDAAGSEPSCTYWILD